MPSQPKAESGPAADPALQADMDHLRTVYVKICSDPEVQRSHAFSPEMRRQLQEAAEPIQKRLQQNGDTRSNQLESQKLSRDEEAEVATVAPNDGRALSLEQRQRIGAIRERYAEKRKALGGKQSESTRQSLAALSDLIGMVSDCSKAGSTNH